MTQFVVSPIQPDPRWVVKFGDVTIAERALLEEAQDLAEFLNGFRPSLPDTLPPFQITNLQINHAVGHLTWTIAVDQDAGSNQQVTGVVGYSIHVNGQWVGTTDVPGFYLGSQYGLVEVFAFDGATPPNYTGPVSVEYRDVLPPQPPTNFRISADGLAEWDAVQDIGLGGYVLNGTTGPFYLEASQTSFQLETYGNYDLASRDMAGNESDLVFATYVEPIGPQITPGTRSVYKEPGSRFARYNLPINSDIVFADHQHFFPTEDFPNGYNWEREVALCDPTAPLIPVYRHIGGTADAPDSFAATYSRRTRTSPLQILGHIRCPINFSFTDADNSIKLNSCTYGVGADIRVLMHYYQFYKHPDDDFATAKTLVEVGNSSRLIDQDALEGSHGGTFLRSPSIRYDEFVNGPAMHALGMVMPGAQRYRPPGITDTTLPIANGQPCWTWHPGMHRIGPAKNGDRVSVYSSNDPRCKAGTHYALPTDISGSMRTQLGAWMAKTLYWFGVYDLDSGAGQPGFCYAYDTQGSAFARIEQVHGYSPRVIRWAPGWGSPRQRGAATLAQFNYLLDLDDMFEGLRAVENPLQVTAESSGLVYRCPLKASILEVF